jgi:FkbM family methyltransferase
MSGAVSTRLRLLQAYVSSERDFPLGLGDLLSRGVLKRPCTSIGPALIERIDPADSAGYRRVHIRGVRTPLAWPAELPLFDLYKVVTECFSEDDWHFYEAPETRVAAGDTVLDCGAAEGIFALRVLERAARVFAFEPLPLFAKSMTETFAGHPHVTVVREALSDVPGHAFLGGNSLYGTISSAAEGIPVRVTTIDEQMARHGGSVDFIKGDLEGFELPTLKGAAETIARHRPKIAITVYHEQNDWRDIVEFLHAIKPDYKIRLKGISFNGARTRPVMLHAW